MTKLNTLFQIANTPGVQVRAMVVPGGLLMITDAYQESGNGVAYSVSTSFVPMTNSDAVKFLEGRQ